MVSIEEIQAAYYMVAATGVLVAAVYYIYNMGQTRKTQELALKSQQQTLDTRQAQLFMQIYDKSTQKEFMKDMFEIFSEWKWTDYTDFQKKYRLNPENYIKFWTVSDYFEGIGVLVKRKLIDPEMVDDMMSGWVIKFWEKIGPMTLEDRRFYNAPQ
jgi:hypothetical protein